MKIIAHGINNIKDAKKALMSGVDFVEVDVSKRIFFNKFTTQHNGLMGILGFGPMLETLLTAEIRSRAFFDLKPVSYRSSFTHKLIELLLKCGVKNAKICGHDWQMLSNLSHKVNAKPYYTIKNLQGINKLKTMVRQLKKPRGFSIKHNLITKSLVRHLKSDYPTSELWAWTVNDLKEANRLAKLDVDGIITDNWSQLSTANNKL
ncbi:hypothetical protein A3D04_00160 [Candidatus Curtissbacteria bacterium RIFCSPHIGHO2_02_FULL_40_16b]|uniref:GP-PDE domain-containing protein n=1 Tax=Candidatus Curtissbacteria bacterium RIFCSPHIGHO2_02_FULL_40_16b TaxID=1797714 RepID=A0A1F5G8Z7_9BACT|nr:MAG: hypothetical protein A3D04_00160 [Candidatus Curtissbacteria bacterium RIFCSPHIGHO2_02_FULL_40_16b]